MEDASTWPDDIKDKDLLPWSYQLHYANTDDWECKYIPNEHINDKDVVHAIRNYSRRLVSASDYDEGNLAAKFVIHFMGDIHQPLHVGFGSDEGGNSLRGTFYGHETNLHAMWDFDIIQHIVSTEFNNDTDSFHEYLWTKLNGKYSTMKKQWVDHKQFLNLPIVHFADETAGLACKYAYSESSGAHVPDNFSLSDSYFQYTQYVLEEQLIKGGARLAGLLNFLSENSFPIQ